MFNKKLTIAAHVLANTISALLLLPMIYELGYWNYHSLKRWGEFTFDEIYVFAILFALLPAAFSWHKRMDKTLNFNNRSQRIAIYSLGTYFGICFLASLALTTFFIAAIYFVLSNEMKAYANLLSYFVLPIFGVAASVISFKLTLAQRRRLSQR